MDLKYFNMALKGLTLRLNILYEQTSLTLGLNSMYKSYSFDFCWFE